MVPRLVTHQIDDTPHLVVISDDPALSDVCRLVAQDSGLMVSVISEKELINQPKTISAYKILWIKLRAASDSDVSEVAARINQENSPWLLVTSVDSAIALLSDKGLLPGAAQPSALVILQEVLTTHTKPSWFEAILSLLAETQVLTFSSNNRNLLRAQEVATAVATQLFKRWHGQVWLLKGVAVTEQAVVEEFAHQYQQYFQKKLQIEPSHNSSKNEVLPAFVQNADQLQANSLPSLSEILQPIVRELSPVFESSPLPERPLSSLPQPTKQEPHVSKRSQLSQKNQESVPQIPPPFFQHHVYPAVNQSIKPVSIRNRRSVGSNSQTEKKAVEQVIEVNEKATNQKNIDKSILNVNDFQETAKSSSPLTTPTLEKELRRLFHVSRVDNKVSTATQLARETIEVVKKNKRKQIFFFFGLLGAGVATAIIILVFILNITVGVVKQQTLSGIELLLSPNQATNEAAQSSLKLEKSLQFLSPQIKAYQAVFPASLVEEAHQVAQLGTSLVAVKQDLARLQQLSSIALRQILGSEVGDSVQSLQLVETTSQSVFEELSLFKAELKGSSLDLKSQKEVVEMLENLSQRLVVSQQLQPVLKKALGTQEKRRYAVILQNEQELRSTGGFIQSVALVTVDRGVVIDYQVFDSYKLDQESRGAISPPAQLAQHLNEKQWFFHDSNWAANGVTANQDMSSFLERIFNGKVDGLITLNVSTLSKIIAALGPIDVPEYNEVITDKNLPERVEFHSEVQLVESSERPKDYMTVVFGKVLQRIQGVSADKSNSLLTALYDSLQHKEMSMYLDDVGEQATIASFGWDGGVLTPPCPVQLSTRGCFVDTVYQVEANIGVNKANYELERSVTQEVRLSQTVAAHSRVMQFTNRARSNSWPKGAYSALVRVLVPETALVDQIKVGNTVLTPQEVTLTKIDGKLEVAFMIVVPIQSSLDVVLDYQVPLELKSGQAYVLFEQKQPGTGQTPVKMSLNLAEGVHAAKIAPQADVLGSTITFNQIKNDHVFVGIQLQ